MSELYIIYNILLGEKNSLIYLHALIGGVQPG